ncbi:transmembrane protein 33-like [Tachypleus tridentatus]|uniref:transmembrane protein 33-like n=1 Tax=Tachypleus tridentatus TaxID=6853 RepID=UPI003FD595FD
MISEPHHAITVNIATSGHTLTIMHLKILSIAKGSVFRFNPYSCYYKALLSNAATSALRLHQRLPNVQLNREFLALLLMEDSCHYLFYSLIYLFSHPITLVLLPIFLFALLHSASYSITMLDRTRSVLASAFCCSALQCPCCPKGKDKRETR